MAEPITATVINEYTTTKTAPRQSLPKAFTDQILEAARPLAPTQGIAPNSLAIREYTQEIDDKGNRSKSQKIVAEIGYANGDKIMLDGARFQSERGGVFYNDFGFSSMDVEKDGKKLLFSSHFGDWNQAAIFGRHDDGSRIDTAQNMQRAVGDAFDNVMSVIREGLEKGLPPAAAQQGGVTGTIERSAGTRNMTAQPMSEKEKQAILKASRMDPAKVEEITKTKVTGDDKIDNGIFVSVRGPGGLLKASRYDLEGLRNGHDKGIQTSGVFNRDPTVSGGLEAAHAYHTTGEQWRGVHLWKDNQPNGFGPANPGLTSTIRNVLAAAGVDPKLLPKPLDAGGVREPTLGDKPKGPDKAP